MTAETRLGKTIERRPRFRWGPLVATVLLSSLVLGVVFSLWTLWGIRAVRQALVSETRRDAVALLQSLLLASQYAVATGSLVDQLERESQAADARRIADLIDPARVDTAILAELSGRWESGGITVWRGRRAMVTFPSSLAGVLAADSDVAGHDWTESGSAPTVLTCQDTSNGVRWVATGIATDWGALALWERVTDETPRAPLGGIGELVQQIGQRSGINYIMLQSPDGIVFASRPLKPVLKLAADSFLVAAVEAETTATREVVFEGLPVLEAVAPFLSSELPSGMFRVGISLSGVKAAERRLTLQLALSALLFLLLATAVIAILLARRSLADLGRSYRRVETLTGRILDAIDQAVVAVDGAGRVSVFNPSAERLTGRSAAESLGVPVREVPGTDGFHLEEVRAGEEPVRNQELSVARPGGSRELVYTTTPITTAEGVVDGAVAIIRDETEARALALQVRRSERLSEMGHLAAGVAHEIRNPLNAIALAAQRLRLEVGDPEAARLATTICDESTRLNAIVEDFLSLARSSTQPPAPVDLSALVESVAAMAALQAQAAHVLLETQIAADQVVVGVADELRKAVWNVMTNALAACSGNGRIRLALSPERSCVALTVEDNGSGIAPEDLSRVFEPWFTTRSGGTGLGLAITHRIVTDHRGTIDIVSPAPGVANGTRVTVRLPLIAV
ncbi:MAG: ATP-binding protein [Candidatus Zixiibacteriota bacterium]